MRLKHYLIIGNGAAGVTAAETLRQQDTKCQITIVTAEAYPMYSRPGLAYVLINEIPPTQIIARNLAWYEQQQIKLIYGRACHIDESKQVVTLDNGRFIPYDRLLIATGARAIPPPYPGHDLTGIVYLDTLDGTKHLLKKAKRARRAVVIGGGITALELAEGLAHQGVQTHYFLRRNRLWGRVFNETEAQLLAQRMHHHGVTIHYQTEIAEIIGNRRRHISGVRLKDGQSFKCDLLGVAIGVKPQLELVQNSSIKTDRAILVNEYMQSNIPTIFAAGDCAQVYDRWTKKHMLDILWPSAVAEGRVAALNMLGQPTPYIKTSPFNACLLFGLHITIIGQINPNPEATSVQHLSRGSSEVWFTYPRTYQSAWSKKGEHTLRLVFDEKRLVGALIIGEQSLADPLRAIIEQQVDTTPLLPFLSAEQPILTHHIKQLWQREVAK